MVLEGSRATSSYAAVLPASRPGQRDGRSPPQFLLYRHAARAPCTQTPCWAWLGGMVTACPP